MRKILKSFKNGLFVPAFRGVSALARLLSLRRPNERVLALSATGIGDTLFGTAALRDLKARAPAVEIAVVTSPAGAAVLANNPDIDRIFTVDRGFSLKTAWRVWRFAPRTVFLFHNSTRLHLFYAACAGTRDFVGIDGYGTKGLDALLTTRLSVPPRTHSVVRRQLLVGQRYPGPLGEQSMRYVVTVEEAARAGAELAAVGARFIVGLQPFAKDFYKQWPYGHWIDFARRLSERLDCAFVVFGGPDDEKPLHHLLKLLPRARRGPAGLRPAAAVLSRLDLLVTPDTGMIHVACALGVPTVGLFSPTDPQQTAPNSAVLRLIHRPHPCGGIAGLRTTPDQCLEKKCRMQLCMAAIEPETVLAAALAALDSTTDEDHVI